MEWRNNGRRCFYNGNAAGRSVVWAAGSADQSAAVDETRREETTRLVNYAVSRSGWPGRAAVMWSRERAAALLAALARANDRFLVGSEADAEAVRGDVMRRDDLMSGVKAFSFDRRVASAQSTRRSPRRHCRSHRRGYRCALSRLAVARALPKELFETLHTDSLTRRRHVSSVIKYSVQRFIPMRA